MRKHREEGDNYHLARYANTGPEHANDCRFHAHAPERSGLVGVVEEADDNTLRIRLAYGLRVNDTAPVDSDASDVQRTPGVKKPSIRLLGLLQLLWLTTGPTQSLGGLRQKSMKASASRRRKARSGLAATKSDHNKRRSACVR